MPGSHIRRSITIGNPTCLLGYTGRGSVDSAVFDSSTLQPGGVDEIQTLSFTGTPTGGTYKLAFRGQTTAAIAYPGTAAAVQTELRKLSRLSPLVAVAGSAGGPYAITFTGAKLGKKTHSLITVAAPALTGGTSPAASVARTTTGDSTFANLYVVRSGLPLMANGDGSKMIEWDGASATTLVGIFDGQIELLDPSDCPIIPVYNHDAVFDKAIVKNYAGFTANYETWAVKHACQFKSQGT